MHDYRLQTVVDAGAIENAWVQQRTTRLKDLQPLPCPWELSHCWKRLHQWPVERVNEAEGRAAVGECQKSVVEGREPVEATTVFL